MLAFLAIALSGGVAKHMHLATAHAHHACDARAGAAADRTTCALVHHHSHHHPHHEAHHAHAEHRHSATDVDDCPVCDELAVNAPAPALHSPFVSVIALLAIVHQHEAAQLPAPQAPDVLAARPPPQRA
jgi:hypothetical protein